MYGSNGPGKRLYVIAEVKCSIWGRICRRRMERRSRTAFVFFADCGKSTGKSGGKKGGKGSAWESCYWVVWGGECMGKAEEGYVISWLHTSLDVIVMYTFIRVPFDVQREVHRLCLSSELGSNFWEVSAIWHVVRFSPRIASDLLVGSINDWLIFTAMKKKLAITNWVIGHTK